ncbi:MAG: Uma2 family endonuclease [Polyangiaceae bacterium]
MSSAPEASTVPRLVLPSDGAALPSGVRFVRAPQPIEFPDEEKVGETRWHLELKTILFQSLKLAFADQAVVGCDQFVYWNPTDPTECLAPDAFVRLGEPDRTFRSWKTWERGAPHLAVEVVSDSDARDANWIVNFDKYRRLGVFELVRFDPDAERKLRIWNLEGNDLIERELADGSARSLCLPGHWLIVVHPELGPSLRLSRDSAGCSLYLTPAEHEAEARKAETEARKAETEARKAAEQRVAELEAELSRLRNG